MSSVRHGEHQPAKRRLDTGITRFGEGMHPQSTQRKRHETESRLDRARMEPLAAEHEEGQAKDARILDLEQQVLASISLYMYLPCASCYRLILANNTSGASTHRQRSTHRMVFEG